MSFRHALVLALTFVLAGCGTVPTAPAISSISSPVLQTPERVDVSASGFVPAAVTIKVGGTVTFVNVGTEKMQPASDPHPTHTDYIGFDSIVGVGVGSTYSFTFTKAGTWKYHDHLHPALSGIVIVE